MSEQQVPTMGLLEELAVRCEIVSGPDRELDALIACETDWPPMGPMISHWVNEEALEPDKQEGYVRLANHPDNPASWAVPEFTGSTDAAMSLIPHGRHTEISMQDRHSGSWKWGLRGGFGVRSEARAPSAARAITAASLRARHALALSKGSDT